MRTVTPEFLPQGHDTPLMIGSSMVCSSDHLMSVDTDSVDQNQDQDQECVDEDGDGESVLKDMSNSRGEEEEAMGQMGVVMMSDDDQDCDGVNASEGGCNESKHSRH